MKWYFISTFSGDLLVRGNNKNEVIQYLEDNNYDIFKVEMLNKYFNEEIGNENNVIIEVKSIFN